ncbi:hypothetical protein CNECB9_1390008 [Cupriavidus necator]|uniref:Uncharacterized protein n=1 Tax=Cupriavidus necator TaxID=106590 RepID=A0A1K0I9I7_CUPNE|nr:hypothetical protein CNECB9_1390008 [Cupriavidus necator]
MRTFDDFSPDSTSGHFSHGLAISCRAPVHTEPPGSPPWPQYAAAHNRLQYHSFESNNFYRAKPLFQERRAVRQRLKKLCYSRR